MNGQMGETVVARFDSAADFLESYRERSSGGALCVATSAAPSLGARVRLTVSFPPMRRPVPIDGRVQWRRLGNLSRQVKPSLGVRVESTDRPVVAQLIERARSARGSSRRRGISGMFAALGRAFSG